MTSPPRADRDPRSSISEFARRVGLSPSALRFYDDCGLLRPAEVDAHSGYRYYASEQERTGVLIRRLREIGMSLERIRVILAGPPEEAQRVLREHAASTTALAGRTDAVVGELIAELRANSGEAPTVGEVGGPELASAIRQVAPAAARRPDLPELTAVLVELGRDEITVVATDRHWMAVRTIPIPSVDGPARRLLVPAAQLPDIAGWAARQHTIRLRVDDAGATLTGLRLDGAPSGQPRKVAAAAHTYPSYEAVLAALAPVATRVLVARAPLLDLIARGTDDTVLVLEVEAERLTVREQDSLEVVRLPAVVTGEPMRLAFRGGPLGGALESGVGPEALFELAAPDRAAVLRSADQGTFTTLVMPTIA